ncbi:MAG: ATP-binding protein, partial [Methylocella sp.]
MDSSSRFRRDMLRGAVSTFWAPLLRQTGFERVDRDHLEADLRADVMANPAGESNDEALRLDFDRRLMLQFRGSAGKTHACLALGLAACQRGFPVTFFTAAGLVHQLMEARDERRLL